jgi:hypothetical protein
MNILNHVEYTEYEEGNLIASSGHQMRRTANICCCNAVSLEDDVQRSLANRAVPPRTWGCGWRFPYWAAEGKCRRHDAGYEEWRRFIESVKERAREWEAMRRPQLKRATYMMRIISGASRPLFIETTRRATQWFDRQPLPYRRSGSLINHVNGLVPRSSSEPIGWKQ